MSFVLAASIGVLLGLLFNVRMELQNIKRDVIEVRDMLALITTSPMFYDNKITYASEGSEDTCCPGVYNISHAVVDEAIRKQEAAEVEVSI